MPLMMKTEQVMSGDLEPPPHCQGIPPASMMGRSLSKIVCSLHYQTTLDVWVTVQPTHAVLDLVGWASKEDTFMIGIAEMIIFARFKWEENLACSVFYAWY